MGRGGTGGGASSDWNMDAKLDADLLRRMWEGRRDEVRSGYAPPLDDLVCLDCFRKLGWM